MKTFWFRFFTFIILPAVIVFLLVRIPYIKTVNRQYMKYAMEMATAEHNYPYHVKGGYDTIEDSNFILESKKFWSVRNCPKGIMYYDEETGFTMLYLSRQIPGNHYFENEMWHREKILLDGLLVLTTVATDHDARLYERGRDGVDYRVFHVVLSPGNRVLGVCPNRSEAVIGILFDNEGDVYGDTGILRGCYHR